jgi:thiol-disulfide isomerase/thioredoxin
MEKVAFWLLLAAIVAGVALLIMAFLRAAKATSVPVPAGKESYQNEPSMLVYFSMNGCAHCQAFNPEWDELVSQVTQDEARKAKITLLKLDAEDARKYGVDRFPTVMYVKGEEKREYEGERTAKALSDFIDEVLAS